MCDQADGRCHTNQFFITSSHVVLILCGRIRLHSLAVSMCAPTHWKDYSIVCVPLDLHQYFVINHTEMHKEIFVLTIAQFIAWAIMKCLPSDLLLAICTCLGYFSCFDILCTSRLPYYLCVLNITNLATIGIITKIKTPIICTYTQLL